jgi:hypothetical protein
MCVDAMLYSDGDIVPLSTILYPYYRLPSFALPRPNELMSYSYALVHPASIYLILAFFDVCLFFLLWNRPHQQIVLALLGPNEVVLHKIRSARRTTSSTT